VIIILFYDIEINCGVPELVMPTGGRYLNNVGPSTTTYLSSNSKFSFDCDPGYDVIGSSGDEEGDNVVKCKDNARWSFGTLACAGINIIFESFCFLTCVCAYS
jgi:hypothetical protein